MLRMMFAVVLLWALTTSGLTAGDVVGAAAAWAADHIEISVPVAEQDQGKQFANRRQETVIDLGPITLRTAP